MNRPPDPLDASERALADLLARDAPPGPSPQLDARILAAARASGPPARRSPPRPRWIAGMGIAATLVLAVGLAWRMRPVPERPMANEAPGVVSTGRVVGSAKTSTSPAADNMHAPAIPEVAPAVYFPGPSARSARERQAVRRESPPGASVVYDEPAPMDVQAPPLAAPPPPPAPAAAATAVASPAPEAYRMDSAQPREQKAAGNLDRIEGTGSRIGAAEAADAAASGATAPSQAELDEEPPATADSPLVQDAWLGRIRELLAAGETEAARRSLAEFSHRYPTYALPEDLRRFAKP